MAKRFTPQIPALVAIVFLSGLSWSCTPTAPPITAASHCPSEGPERRNCLREWTLLVYMAADNDDLPAFARASLREMAAAVDEIGPSFDVDVVVELDLDTPPGLWRFHIVPCGVDRVAPLGFPQGDDRAASPTLEGVPVLEIIADEAIAPADALERFLDWGVRDYPARHYAVVYSGHGQGWRPRRQPGIIAFSRANFTGGLGWDASQGTVLDIPSLRDVLRRVSIRRLGGRPFDLFVSNACLMQSVEVATELTDAVRFVIGSEQIEDYYLELDYDALIPALNAAADLEPRGCPEADAACRVAHLIPALQAESAHGNEGSGHGANTLTSSAIHTDALDAELLPALERLSRALESYLAADFMRAFDLELLLGSERLPDFLGGTRDLGVFLQRLRELTCVLGDDGELHASIDAVERALEISVGAKSLGSDYESDLYRGMAGLAVWLPADRADFERRREFFETSRFYRRASWQEWIDATFSPPLMGVPN